MIQVEFYKNSDKEKMNWKERPAVAQIRRGGKQMQNQSGEERTRKEAGN